MNFDRVMPPFLIIISTTVAHVQLRFNIWTCLMNIPLEFKFGFGLMIELCLFNLEKNEKFSFSVL